MGLQPVVCFSLLARSVLGGPYVRPLPCVQSGGVSARGFQVAKQRVNMRVDEELLAWADGYARSRGVTRTALLEGALVSFKADCEGGVPELREMAASQAALSHSESGIGDCPERGDGLGHVWSSAKVDSRRPCVFCQTPGRGGTDDPPGHLELASAERAALFSRLRAPDSGKGFKPGGRAGGSGG